MKFKEHFFLYLIIIVLTSSNCSAQEFHGTITTPVYPGALNTLKEFIMHNIRHPEDAKKEGVSGVVTVSYFVNEQGEVENIKILRGLDEKCNFEAVRVAQLIKGWQPAMQWEKPVSVKVIMPVEFQLGNNNRKIREFTVTGNISDRSNGKPLEGSLVVVKNSNIGAVTDKNGNYSILVPEEESELEIISIGYETKSEKVGINRIINVELLTQDFVIDFNSN